MTETYRCETYPTQSKIDNVTTKITSGSAARAATSKGSTTATGIAGFGAAGAEAGGGGKAGSSWSAIAKRTWWRLAPPLRYVRHFVQRVLRSRLPSNLHM